jgi:eukaryotic-like serine/threonine-protein kinase
LPRLTLAPGTRLGPYEILSALGAGGMGEVYRARDPRLDRQVTIKLLPGELAADQHSRDRLRREAMAVAAVDHPYICKIFEIGEHGEPCGWPQRSPRRSRKPMPAGFCTAI